MQTTATPREAYCFSLLRFGRKTAKKPTQAVRIAPPPPKERTETKPAEADAFVVTKTVAIREFRPVDVREDGDTEHEDAAGCPEQLIATVWLKPPIGVAAIGYVAVWPGWIVAVVDEADNEKSGAGVAVDIENLVMNTSEQAEVPQLDVAFNG